jgi:hypothetical protein
MQKVFTVGNVHSAVPKDWRTQVSKPLVPPVDDSVALQYIDFWSKEK